MENKTEGTTITLTDKESKRLILEGQFVKVSPKRHGRLISPKRSLFERVLDLHLSPNVGFWDNGII